MPVSTCERERETAAQLKLQANALAGQGKLESARDIYMRALELAPPHIEYKLHSNMSLLALSSGDTTEALAQAQKALELAPQDFTTVRSSSAIAPFPNYTQQLSSSASYT